MMADAKHEGRKKRRYKSAAHKEKYPAKKSKKDENKSTEANMETRKSGCSSISPEDETRLLQEIFEMMKYPEQRFKGLKKLCLCSRQSRYQSLMTRYLRMSPDCQELFHMLEAEDKPTTDEMKWIWNAFEAVLLSATGEESLQGVGMRIVNTILSKHIKLLYSAMSPSGSSELTIAVLKLLTSFLAQGKEGVRDVLHNFDFSLKGIEVAVRKRDKNKNDDARTCFLKLFVGFFIFGDLTAVKEALKLQVLIRSVIGGLFKDKLDMIHLVIETLTNKVVTRIGLSKQSKLALFTRDNLIQLATLYVKLNKENDKMPEDWMEVRTDILRMLLLLCTDKTHSIVFPNTMGYFSYRSNNPVLLGFLSGIQKLAVTESGLQDLISKTLSAAPDLVIPFVSKLDLNIELRESQQWKNKINFIIEIWNSLPQIDDVEEECVEINHELLGNTVIPKICSRSFFTNGIKHQSSSVKQKTMDLIISCLQRATSICHFIRRLEDNSTLDVKHKSCDSFIENMLRELPIPRAIVNLLQECSEVALNRQQNKINSEAGGTIKGVAIIDSDSSDLKRSIVKAMKYLQHLRPGIFTAVDYNLCKLFHDNFNSMKIDLELANDIVSILLYEPRGNLKWLAKKPQIYKDAVKDLLTIYISSTSKDMKRKYEQLIKRVALECRVIQENKEEIGVWLDVFAQCYRLKNDDSIIDFFQQILVSCVHDLFSIMNEILEISFKELEDKYQDLEPTDATNICKNRYEFTPLVIAAFRCFAMEKLVHDEKDDLEPISIAVTTVLMNIMMSQQNPILLSKMVSKYCKILKEKYSNVNCKWLFYWQDLERFSLLWTFDSIDGTESTEKSVVFDQRGGRLEEGNTANTLLTKSVASFIRYGLFSAWKKGKMVKLYEDDEHFKKDIESGINWNSIDSIGWSLKVILNTLHKLLLLKSFDTISLLADILKESVVKCETSFSSEDAINGPVATEDNQFSYVDILILVLESSAVKEVYLSTSQPRASEAVTEILQCALKHKASDVATITKCYVEKLLSEVSSLLRRKKSHPTCFLNLMQNLQIFASYLSIEEHFKFLSSILRELLEFCLNAAHRLSNTETADAITHLINFLSDVYSKHVAKGNLCFSSSIKQKAEKQKSFILKESSGVSWEEISSLFKLYENGPNAVVEDLLILLLKLDCSLTVLASENTVTACLHTPSQNSIQLLRIITHSSPHLALVLLKSFEEASKTLMEMPKSFVIQIAHTLLSSCYDESRMKIECVLRSTLCRDFISVLTYTEEYADLAEAEFKMICDVLKAISKDHGGYLTLLIQSLEAVSHSSSIHAQSRFVVQLFADCIGEFDEYFEQDPNKPLHCLISLMRIWEKSISSKDFKGQVELTITVESCIKCFCGKLIEVKYKKIHATDCESLIKIWTSLLPSCLKNCFKNAHSMEALKHLMTFLYGVKRFRMLSTLTLENVYERIFSHSQFFPVLFDHKSDNSVKGSILSLLLSIAKFKACVFEKSHLKALLAAYNASLSTTDQILVMLLKMYESHGVSALSLRPLKWGKSLLSSTPSTNDVNLSTYNHSSISEIMDSLDHGMLIKSAFNFPLKLDVTKFDEEDTSCLRADLYDPRFLFPIFSYILSSRFTSDCRRFIEHGCLAFTIAALSSQISSTRRAAYHVLVRFMNQIENAIFREKNQVVVLLNALKNTIKEEGMIVPSIICCFTLCCLKVIFKPDHLLYGILNNLLLRKPFLDFRHGSIIMELFNNCSLQNKSERLWLLKVIGSGLRTAPDYYIYKKSHVFQHLMSSYNSPFCDNSIKEKINDVIIAAAGIHPAAFDLVKCHGLLLWLLGSQSPSLIQHDQFVIRILQTLLDTFEAGCKVVDDDGKEEIKRPIPRNFAAEAALLCFSIADKVNYHLSIEYLEVYCKILQIGTESDQNLIQRSLRGRETRIFCDNLDSFMLEITIENPEKVNKTVQIISKILRILLKSCLQRGEKFGYDVAEYIAWLIKMIAFITSKGEVQSETLDVLSDSVMIAISAVLDGLCFTEKEASWLFHLLMDFVNTLTSLNANNCDKVSRKFTYLRSLLKNLLALVAKHFFSEEGLMKNGFESMSLKLPCAIGTYQEVCHSKSWFKYLKQLVDGDQVPSEEQLE